MNMKVFLVFALASMLAFAPAAALAQSVDSPLTSVMAKDKTKDDGKKPPKGGGGC